MRTPTDEMPQLIDRDQLTELQAAAENHDQWARM